MRQEQEEFKGLDGNSRGLIGGMSTLATGYLAHDLLPETSKGKVSAVLATIATIGAAYAIGKIAYNGGEAAKAQFDQNQQTIAQQANIIEQAEHQGLIQTKTVVERGPAA